MGVDLATWRCRIGTFCHPGGRTKVVTPAIVIGWPSTGVRLLVLMSLLIMAGDIELNPGPPHRQAKEQTDRYSQATLNFGDTSSSSMARRSTRLHPVATDADRHLETNNTPRLHDRNSDSDVLQEILNKVGVMTVEMGRMNSRFDDIDRKLDREITALRRDNEDLHQRMDYLEDRCDQLEAQSRRNNLIFKGIPESSDEKWSDTENKIRSFLVDKLNFTDGEANNIEIERSHRLPGRGRNRLVITKFLSYKDREKVLSAARENLRGDPDVAVKEDFTQRVRDTRSKLFTFMKEARDRGRLAYLSYDKLRIDNVLYRYDHETNNIAEIRRFRVNAREQSTRETVNDGRRGLDNSPSPTSPSRDGRDVSGDK